MFPPRRRCHLDLIVASVSPRHLSMAAVKCRCQMLLPPATANVKPYPPLDIASPESIAAMECCHAATAINHPRHRLH
jgi:hypothetical protein